MTSPQAPSQFDYVVVGSGAGGGPLAANLAEAGYRTLLLEAGTDFENYNYQVPSFHAAASEDEGLRWDYFVRHYADEDQQRRDAKFVAERGGVLYPRAGTLGGCTAHNAMITVYPHNFDWDGIATLTGDPTWRSSNMRCYFERLERCQYIRPPRLIHNRAIARLLSRVPVLASRFVNRSRHGYHGWLTTNMADPKLAGRDMQLIKVLLESVESVLSKFLGRPLTLLEGLNTFFDPNDWRVVAEAPQGMWFVPLATSGGRRTSARERVQVVRASLPDKLVVRTNALVSRVVFEGTRAVAVEYLDLPHAYRADPRSSRGDGAMPPAQTVSATREVILSGGAFNTPQLLKLSGVGPRQELTALGIDVVVDLPGVGENLQDRYEVGVVMEMREDFALIKDCSFKAPESGQEPDACFREWEDGKGVYSSNGAVVAIIRKSRDELPVPDLFIFGLPAFFQGYYPGYSDALERHKNFFTFAILKAHTKNQAGSVKLRSADPRDTPDINFRYFEEGSDAEGEDLDSMVSGVQFVRAVAADAEELISQELVPGPAVQTAEDIKGFVRDQAWGHHASCTCKIGTADDPMAVLDTAFRVRGTTGLRVVDASVFPRIPGFFIVSAVYMVAEKASDVILADARRSDR